MSPGSFVPPVVLSPKQAPQPVVEASEVMIILEILGACNHTVRSSDAHQRRSCRASSDRGSLILNWPVRAELSSASGDTEFIKAWIPLAYNVGELANLPCMRLWFFPQNGLDPAQ